MKKTSATILFLAMSFIHSMNFASAGTVFRCQNYSAGISATSPIDIIFDMQDKAMVIIEASHFLVAKCVSTDSEYHYQCSSMGLVGNPFSAVYDSNAKTLVSEGSFTTKCRD